MKFQFIFLILFCGIARAQEFKNTSIRDISTNHYEILEYNLEKRPEFHFPAGAKIRHCQILGKQCHGPVVTLQLPAQPLIKRIPKLFSASYDLNGKTKNISAEIFNGAFPRLKFEGESGLPHPLIFSLISGHPGKNRNCYLFSLSGKGEVKFYKRLPVLCGDFRPHQLRDKTYYSYYELREGIENVGGSGPRVILDDQFQYIKTIDLELDGHEFLLLNLNHWIGIEIELGRLTNGKTYLNKLIRERKDGKILFEWSVNDYFTQMKSELTASTVLTGFRNEVVAEVLHLNSLQMLKKRRLLVGLAYNGVALLDMDSRKIQWHFAGVHDDFKIPIEQNPLFEHSAVLSDSNELCLFSNLTVTTKGLVSKVLCYALNLEKKFIESFRVLRDKNEQTSMMGGMQIIQGRPNIFFGLKKSAPYDFVEMHEGKDVWKLSFGDDWIVYRFYRAPQGELNE